jgi:chromatin remodeling complex protein RSC6
MDCIENPDVFTKLFAHLENMKKEVALLITVVKGLEKKTIKASKQVKHNKSGFVKPVAISEELRTLVGASPGELVARCVVNKKINEYIKFHDLQVPSDRQTFVIDHGLSLVFEVEVGSIIHYFKMQSYLKHHYPKETC